jgi:hypothetical protein
MLVTGAGLMIRSFREVVSTVVGFITVNYRTSPNPNGVLKYVAHPGDSRIFPAMINMG